MPPARSTAWPRAEPVARIPAGLATGDSSYGTTLVGFEQDTSMHTFLAPDGNAESLPADGLLVGDALRSKLSLASRREVTLTTEDGGSATVRIAGFVHEPLGTYAYASLDYLRATLGSAPVDAATCVHLRAHSTTAPRSTPPSQASRTSMAWRRWSAATPSSSCSTSSWASSTRSSGVMFVLGALLAFALIYATISANVSERTVELANLRASGMSAGEIGRMITAENLLLTAIGVVPGLIVGYLGADGSSCPPSRATCSPSICRSDRSALSRRRWPPSSLLGLSLLPALRAVSQGRPGQGRAGTRNLTDR